MTEQKVLKNAADVVARPKDFVKESQDIEQFSLKYSMQKNILGKGAFGKVKLATLKANGEKRAVKIIDKLILEESEHVRLKYEIDILKNLNHPNIVQLYEVFESKSSLYLVTELCDGCELFDEITLRKNFNENQAAEVIKQVLNAIAYCHSKNVAHRDLKPENLLIDTNNRNSIKVIDFGTS
jgi:calcium-dependent protein kinase